MLDAPIGGMVATRATACSATVRSLEAAACTIAKVLGASIWGTGFMSTRSRQGYAVETAHALTAAAFDVPEVERVEIHHDEANVRSCAVPRSLGFTPGPERPDGISSPGRLASTEAGRSVVLTGMSATRRGP